MAKRWFKSLAEKKAWGEAQAAKALLSYEGPIQKCPKAPKPRSVTAKSKDYRKNGTWNGTSKTAKGSVES